MRGLDRKWNINTRGREEVWTVITTSYHLQVYHLIEIYKLHVWVTHKVKYDEFYSEIYNVLVIWYLIFCGLSLVL